jgi:hypothetical protein
VLPASEQEARMLRAALAGPFLDDGGAGLVPNPLHAGPGPHVERVRFLQADGTDPGLMLRLGEADLAVLYGREAGGLIDDDEQPLRMSRAPGWDRTYFLWLEPRHRWINDPALRRWLAGVLDREPMLRFLFDGRGAAAYSLSSPEPNGPSRSEPEGTPFGRHSRPRLSLRFDPHDPHARSIAARIRAVLDSRGVELTLLPRDEQRLLDELRAKEVELALLVHRATSEDAVEALGRTLERLGSGDGSPGSARRTEQALLADARIVPLVRLDAWLARPHRLEGVTAGAYPVLRLEQARWRH